MLVLNNTEFLITLKIIIPLVDGAAFAFIAGETLRRNGFKTEHLHLLDRIVLIVFNL